MRPTKALHVQIQTGDRGSGPPSPGKSQNIEFLSNTGPDPLTPKSYRVSIQFWAIIGTPAKRHFFGPPLTKLSGSAHALE